MPGAWARRCWPASAWRSLLSNRIARSFANLQHGAAALGAGKAVAVPPSRIRELDLMGRALEAAAGQHATHEQERSRLLASLEEALAASRDASLVKDEFLAVLGHELRNPLSPIVASLDLMDLRADERQPARAHHHAAPGESPEAPGGRPARRRRASPRARCSSSCGR